MIRFLKSLEKNRPLKIIIPLGYSLTILIAFFDHITNPEYSFSIFFLLPITFITLLTNRVQGLILSFISAVLWLVLDLRSGLPHQSSIAPYWNSLVRFGFFSIVVFLLSKLTELYRSLEIIVEKRTQQLTNEIKERKNVEQKLRTSRNLYQNLVENISEIYYTADPIGKIIYGSPNLFKTMDCSEEFILGKSYIRLIDRRDRKRVREYFLSKVNDGTVDASTEFRLKSFRGNSKWYEQTTRIVRDGNAEPVEFRCILRDISQRKNAELALLKSEARIQCLFDDSSAEIIEKRIDADFLQNDHAFIMKDLAERINEISEKMRKRLRQTLSFSSMASHELRTPLTIIRNQLEDTLRTDTPQRVLRKTVASAYDEILRLQRVIKDLLDLGKMEAGNFRLHKTITNFRNLIFDFYIEVNMLAKEKNIEVLYEDGPPVNAEIDVDYFLQMLFNLFDNALKNTPEGGKIKINYSICEKDIVLVIEDTGYGISSKRLSKVFEPFYVEDNISSFSKGTGLGLLLSKWIIELHQGRIEIQSEPHKGTKVILSLPSIQS